LAPSPNLAVDGIFGPLTLQAVLEYQKGVSIAVDGVVGKKTWYHLLKGDKATVLQTPIAAPRPAVTSPTATSSTVPQPPRVAPPPAPPESIWEWPLEKKLLAVLERVPSRLPGRARDEFKALLQLENLALSLAIIAGFCLLSGGTALVLGIVILGLDITMSLASAVQIAALAANEQELNEAADELAHIVLAVGVAAFIKGVGKIAKGIRGGGKGGAAEAPPKQVAEPTPPRPKTSPKAELSETPPKPKQAAEPVAKPNVVKSKAGYTYDLAPGDPSKPVRFGQRGVSPEFSKKGRFKGADIDSVAEKLKSGELQPSDVPVDYIWVNGEKVVVNNRSATALSKAGIPQEKWVMDDKTGKLPPDGPDSLPSVLERLDEMGGKPADSMPVRLTDDRSGPIKESIPISK
jgi:hypothetical protein